MIAHYHEGIGALLDEYNQESRDDWKANLSLIGWDKDNLFFSNREGYDTFLEVGFYY